VFFIKTKLTNIPRSKGSQNKITSEVKEKTQLLIDDLIASLNVNELDANQRIKMLQIVLQYTLPRMKQATNEGASENPCFNCSAGLNRVKLNNSEFSIWFFFTSLV
jgi:hypothetical protein|tara:strand:- start:137 stop:454 length:318 start_codon:yes stop_codon:yes gene_type:complete